ncbi:MAG TPA: hypothetical protein VFO14_09770 [Vicinamibacterales bacterium]|nr:hypothetical protein [Vicinamibacterales bacterium]
MRPVECPREQDLLDALTANRWPGNCDEPLRLHVSTCPVCADLLEIVVPLRDAGQNLPAASSLPSAGTVWWRAQIRARREAAREAAGPVTVAQMVAFVSALLAVSAGLWAAGPWLAGFGALLPGMPSLDIGGLPLPDPVDLLRWRWVIGAIAAWLVLAPLAVYFAILED